MIVRVTATEDTVQAAFIDPVDLDRLTAHWARHPDFNEYVGADEGRWITAAADFYICGTPVGAGEQFRLLSRAVEPFIWEIRRWAS